MGEEGMEDNMRPAHRVALPLDRGIDGHCEFKAKRREIESHLFAQTGLNYPISSRVLLDFRVLVRKARS